MDTISEKPIYKNIEVTKCNFENMKSLVKHNREF